MTDLPHLLLDAPHESRAGSRSEYRMAAPRELEGHAVAWMLVTLAWTLIYGIALFFTLDRQFDRPFDSISSAWNIAGRNLLQNGFTSLRGGCYISAGDLPRFQRLFYGSRPPMLAWITAPWLHFFGAGDRATRALPVAFTLLNVLLIFSLARRALGPIAGFFAAALYSLMPMTAYYAQVINTPPFAMTAMLCASLAYLRVHQSGSRLAWVALLISLALGCWTDFEMMIFAGLLAAAHFFTRPSWRQFGSAALIATAPLLMFAGFALYVRFNDGSFYESTIDRAVARLHLDISMAPGGDVGRAYVTLWSIVRHPHALGHWIVGLLTPTVCALALVSLATWRWWSRDCEGDRSARAVLRTLIFVTILTQVIYTVGFAQLAARFEYWQYFLTLPIALLAAGICGWAVQRVMRDGVNLAAAAGLTVLLIAAATPAAAWHPFSYRMEPWHDSPVSAGEEELLNSDQIHSLRAYTDPGDLIFTRAPNVGLSIAWYTDRMVLGNKPIATPDDLAQRAARYSQSRVLYLCSPITLPALFDALKEKYPLYRAGSVQFFLVRGQPDSRWER